MRSPVSNTERKLIFFGVLDIYPDALEQLSQFGSKFGRDDIVRARDGAYFGLAENYH